MNRAQRITLWVVLIVDFLLILYPPLQAPSRFRAIDLGHHWIVASGYPRAHISFGELAAEIVVVSLVGFTLWLVAGGVSDERTAAFGQRLSAFGRAVPTVVWSVLAAIAVFLVTVGVVIGLAQLGVHVG